jgi:DNA-nicking Smr family endonuclease
VKRRPGKNDNADAQVEGDAADAEAEYFASAMADVIPLTQDPRGRVSAGPHVGAPRAALSSPSSSTEQDSDSSDAAFVAAGVDRRELRKLKRGEHAPGSRLDLHGMTAAQAISSVQRFIDNGRHRHRCVCIVHGRGLHSEGNVSILKARVRACLRRHRAVLAYADASRADGGTGAVYVLLRK